MLKNTSSTSKPGYTYDKNMGVYVKNGAKWDDKTGQYVMPQTKPKTQKPVVPTTTPTSNKPSAPPIPPPSSTGGGLLGNTNRAKNKARADRALGVDIPGLGNSGAGGSLFGGTGIADQSVRLGSQFSGFFAGQKGSDGKVMQGKPTDTIRYGDVGAYLTGLNPSARLTLQNMLIGSGAISAKDSLDANGFVSNDKLLGGMRQVMFAAVKQTNGNLTTLYEKNGWTPQTAYDPAAEARAAAEAARQEAIHSRRQATEDQAFSNLQGWGLESLSPQIHSLAYMDVPLPEILNMVRATDVYKQNFVGIDDYRAKYDSSLTEDQYLSMKKNLIQTGQSLGIDASLLTNESVGKLIGGGVSAEEFKSRVVNGYDVIKNANPSVIRALQEQHGLTKQDLLNHIFDPNFTSTKAARWAEQASITGYAQDIGFGEIGTKGALQLGKLIAGGGGASQVGQYSRQQVQGAIDAANKNMPLTRGIVGGETPSLDRKALVGSEIAGFQGTIQSVAQKATQKTMQAQVAPFQKGGGFEASTHGLTGLGSAPQ